MSFVPSVSLQEKLHAYQALLEKWQVKINLVSPHTVSEAKERHFADSLQLVELIPDTAKNIVDLGSGAGFPGLVLAMALPDKDIHLVEADQKKCSFMRTVSRETSTPVTIHTERIEAVNLPVVPDIITARALAQLGLLMTWCSRWIEQNPNLILIFPKGAKAQEELNSLSQDWLYELNSVDSQTEKEGQILIFRNLKKR